MSAASDIITLKLQHPGSCTGLFEPNFKMVNISNFSSSIGMYWRGDPTTKSSPPSNDNWPKNGALLKGTGPVIVNGEKYFKVLEIQQAGTQGFKSVPEGTYMLYEQGGKVLHET